MPANLLLVGAAYQSGALPVSAEAIEWAIELNGVAVAANTAAFRWGRVAVADPDGVRRRDRGSDRRSRPPTWTELGELAGETRRLAGIRAQLLADYQDARTARRYVNDLLTVWRAERRLGEDTAFSEAVARGLHKLTAYKDEYEVARLLTDPAFEARLAAEVPGGTGLRYRLHPPTLKALGRQHKIAFGPWMRPVLQALARGKALRGTPLDPFGRAPIRQLERALRDEYRALVLRLAAELTRGLVRHGRRRRGGRRPGARLRGRQARRSAPLPGAAGRAGVLPRLGEAEALRVDLRAGHLQHLAGCAAPTPSSPRGRRRRRRGG